jgi:PAS domain S-box-containing protein
MKVESEQLLTKTPQGINASRSGVGLSPKAHALLKLFDGTMAMSGLKRICLEESIAEAEFQSALKELLKFEHLRVIDGAAPDAGAKVKPTAADETERKMLLTLDFTPWDTPAGAKTAAAVHPATSAAPRLAAATPAIAATAANRAPAASNLTGATTAAGAVAAPTLAPDAQPLAQSQDARDEKAAKLRQETEVRQKLIATLQPQVEEELRARLRPKLEQELRPKLIAALRPGLEAELRTALTKELSPRVELELKARMAKTLAAQKVADQQAMKPEPVADTDRAELVARAESVALAASDSGGFERVLASLNLPVFSIDKTGVCTYMSPAWVQFSGYTAADTVGKPLMDFFAQSDRRAIVAMLTGIANGTALRFEQQGALLRRGGDPLWVEISAAPLYAASGEPVGVCGAIRDAAESRRTADQAEADGVRLLLLVDQIDTGVLLEDGEGNIQQANPALCTLLSLDAAPYSLEGMPVTELHASAAKGFIAPDGFLQRVAEIRAAGEDSKGESFVMADGRVIAQDYLEVTAGTNVVGHLWLYRDMPRPPARAAS